MSAGVDETDEVRADEAVEPGGTARTTTRSPPRGAGTGSGAWSCSSRHGTHHDAQKFTTTT